MFFEKSFNLVSNIIKTNNSKTATAPTYIIVRINPKNSSSNKKRIIEVIKKLKTKNNKAKKVFCIKTTHKALIHNKVK